MFPAVQGVPPCRDLSGKRELCPFDQHVADPEFEQATDGTLMGCLVRLVAGYDPDRRTFGRTRYSYQMFSGLEVGWAHAAGDAGQAQEVLSEIARQLPDVARFAWGEEGAALLADPEQADKFVRGLSDQNAHPQAADWLLGGWHAIAGRGDVQSVFTAWWHDQYVAPVVKWMQEAGLRDARTLAAGVRMNNSSRTKFKLLRDKVAELGEEAGRAAALEEYGHPDRTERINTWACFQGPVVLWPEPQHIAWNRSAAPERPPSFPEVTQSGYAPPVSLTGQADVITAKGAQLASGLVERVRRNPLAVGGVLAAIGLAIAGAVLYSKRKPKRRSRRRR